MKQIVFLVMLAAALFSAQSVYADPVPSPRDRHSGKARMIKPLLRPGYLYQLSSRRRLPVFYSRDYRRVSRSVFETVYSVYDPAKKALAQIVASHDKRRHQVTVTVRDFAVKGYPIANTEVHGYNTPFPGPFGHIGKVGAANKNNPGQMMVRFATRRADYVQVISIADAHEDSGRNLQVYTLEKK